MARARHLPPAAGRKCRESRRNGARQSGEQPTLGIFPGVGAIETPVRDFDAMTAAPIAGPLLVEANFTTIVVDPGAVARSHARRQPCDPARSRQAPL